MKKFINAVICHFLYRVTYEGLENLTSQSRCIICPNHSNIFDPFFIYPVSNNLHIMAKSEIFKYKFLARIFKYYNVFSVNRNKKDSGSLFYSIGLFENNKDIELLIFPEGGILKTENEIGKRIRNGAVFISAKAKVPIVPV